MGHGCVQVPGCVEGHPLTYLLLVSNHPQKGCVLRSTLIVQVCYKNGYELKVRNIKICCLNMLWIALDCVLNCVLPYIITSVIMLSVIRPTTKKSWHAFHQGRPSTIIYDCVLSRQCVGLPSYPFSTISVSLSGDSIIYIYIYIHTIIVIFNLQLLVLSAYTTPMPL